MVIRVAALAGAPVVLITNRSETTNSVEMTMIGITIPRPTTAYQLRFSPGFSPSTSSPKPRRLRRFHDQNRSATTSPRPSQAPPIIHQKRLAMSFGWSTFELIIIATAAAALSKHLFGFSGKWLWTLAFGVASWGLGMLGPIGFVRRYLRKFASWALLFSMAYLTYWAISKSHLHAFWAQPGKGGFPSFGQAVDLVIGSVVSWTPLAADYTRFSRSRRDAFYGAAVGYFVPTIWCIGLGVLIVLGRRGARAQALPAAVAAAGGVAFVALAAIT